MRLCCISCAWMRGGWAASRQCAFDRQPMAFRTLEIDSADTCAFGCRPNGNTKRKEMAHPGRRDVRQKFYRQR